MADSALATYTHISKHNSGKRTEKISKIVIHHMSGKMTAKQCADYFVATTRSVSSNYTIGYDGSIAVSVHESDRAWTSSSRWADQRAVTIEVSNDGGAPDWHVSDKAMAALIRLCADICTRNGIKKLYYDGTTNGTLLRHCQFSNTDCPGPYLKAKTDYICTEVNKLIGSTVTPVKTEEPQIVQTAAIAAGDIVKIASGASYYTGTAVPGWVQKLNWVVSEVKGDRAVIDASSNGVYHINSPISVRYLTAVGKSNFKSYKVRVTVEKLNIRKGPGMNYQTDGQIKDKGVYTIVDESNGWGKLKSGAGWIWLAYTKRV